MERCPSGLRCTPGTRVWIIVHRGFESRSLRIIFMKKLCKILSLIVLGVSYTLNLDSVAYKKAITSDKSVLIPNYDILPSNFEIEYLDKRRKFFIDFQLSYLENNNDFRVNFSPILNLKNLKFKINLDYAFTSDSSNYQNINDPLSVLESIEYLNYKILDGKLNLFLGEIKNFTTGHGYLVNNYNNRLTYPIKRNIGFLASLSNTNKSVKYDLFISNLRDFSENAGLVSNKLSFLFSNDFPLNFGFSHVTDLNQFSKYRELELDYKRRVDAFQFDFTFPVIKNAFENLYLIGELVGIDYPEKRFYIRVDDSQFTNDKKSRNGIWGIAFPGIIYENKNLVFKIAANYNSAIYAPYYFNSTYDFENIRFRNYNIQENEALYSDEADLLSNYSNSDSTIFIPKDMYGMINQHENTYPTYGFSTKVNLKINKDNNVRIEYSYFKNISEIDDSFYNTFTFYCSTFNKILFFPTKFDIYLSKNFFKISESYTYDENLTYGLSFNALIYKSVSFIGDLRHTFYDMNYDGKIDLVPYVNIGLNYNY